MTVPPKAIVHLLSGGLDSVTLLYDLVGQGHCVHCVLIDYKQPHAQELIWAKCHASRCGSMFTTVDLPDLGGLNENDWVVPNRNAIFLSIAVNIALQAGADTVTIGCNADDATMFPDCRPLFIQAMNAAVKAAGYSVEICAPYLFRKKWEIGGLAQELGIALNETWSCYKGGRSPCGKCPACVKLTEAIR